MTAEAEAAWVERCSRAACAPFIGNPDCTPGYYNNEGGVIGRKERLNGSGYPDGPVAYWQYLDRWRNVGRLRRPAVHLTRPNR